MPKLIILIILLLSTFCSAQSPDDHVVYPDTSLVIGEIHGIEDTGYWHETTNIVPFSYNTMERYVDTLLIIDFEPIVKNVLKDILNQNKPAMKKFEYRTNVAEFKDIQKNCNQIGALGWELVAVSPIVDTITFLLVFKIEIIE